MSTLNKIENAKVELVCKIEGEQWQKAQEVAFDKLAKRVDIKGFRKGKAPKHLVRQHISQGDVLMFAVDEVVENAFKDAIIEHGVELIDQDESFIFPDYSGLKVTIQDCWRLKERIEVQEAVRSILRKMNIEFVEIKKHHQETDFCGKTLYRPQIKRNSKFIL